MCIGILFLVTSLILFQAVRHLPSSQQEEYYRLKRQIAELEEQRRRCQQQQHQPEQEQKQLPPTSLSTNETNLVSDSLQSSPSLTAAVSSSINHPLNIAPSDTTYGKKGALQNSVTSVALGSDSGKILRMQPAQNKRPSNLLSSKDALLQKEAASDKGIAHTASPAPVMSEEQRETTEKASNLANVVRQEEESVMEAKDGLREVHDVSMHELLEQKEAKLAEIEHQLLSKR